MNAREKLRTFLNTENDDATLDMVVPFPRIPFITTHRLGAKKDTQVNLKY